MIHRRKVKELQEVINQASARIKRGEMMARVLKEYNLTPQTYYRWTKLSPSAVSNPHYEPTSVSSELYLPVSIEILAAAVSNKENYISLPIESIIDVLKPEDLKKFLKLVLASKP